MCVCELCSFYTFFICSVELTVSYVVHYCSREEVDVLKHYSEASAQVRLFNPIDIDAVIAYFAVCNIVKAIYEIGNSCFARTCCADKGNFLPWFCKERYVVKYRFAFFVFKINFAEAYITRDADELRTVKFFCSRIFPSPNACALFAFYKDTVFFSAVYESNIAVIFFRSLIYKCEDTLGAGKSHCHRVNLL